MYCRHLIVPTYIAFEVSSNEMRYINLRFTYLLFTYSSGITEQPWGIRGENNYARSN